MAIKLLITMTLVFLAASCRESNKRQGDAAVDASQQCRAQGVDYEWRNGQCINIAAERECLSRSNHTWQNGMCVARSQAEIDCLQRGGLWQQDRCVMSSDQYASCQQRSSFTETLSCIEQGTISFRQRLEQQAHSVRNLGNVSGQFDNLQQKAASLRSSGITSDMSGFKKVGACWNTNSMASSLRRIAGELEFSDPQLLNEAQNFVTGMRTSVRHLQDHINCPIKI